MERICHPFLMVLLVFFSSRRTSVCDQKICSGSQLLLPISMCSPQLTKGRVCVLFVNFRSPPIVAVSKAIRKCSNGLDIEKLKSLGFAGPWLVRIDQVQKNSAVRRTSLFMVYESLSAHVMRLQLQSGFKSDRRIEQDAQ